MKKTFWILIITALFCAPVFAQERYIIFFAETSDIPQAIALKILSSNRFCMVVPFGTNEKINPVTDELLSAGKFEPAISFTPEPLFPVLAEVYSASGKNSGFSDYISGNFSDFSSNFNRNKFGIFLKSGVLSNNVLYYFAGIQLPWINIKTDTGGFYQVSGVPAFTFYSDFPYNQSEVLSWLEKKKDTVIPVLLTKKHLSNTALMNYIIGLFDSSIYVKPAVPLFIAAQAAINIPKRTITFDSPDVDPNLLSKLHTAASYINKFRTSSKFNDISYRNAQDELSFLTGADLLTNAAKGDITGVRLFDATYNNIFRLLGFPIPGDTAAAPAVSISTAASALKIGKIDGGILIADDSSMVLKSISVTIAGDSIKVDIGTDWNSDLSFIDLYIDMNNIEWAGSTAMMSGVNGFLTSDSGWEYAVRVRETKAYLYRYSSSEGASLLAELPVYQGAFLMPQKFISGNPANWGFQAVAYSNTQGAIIDFLNGSAKSKAEILSTRPFQVPAVRLK